MRVRILMACVVTSAVACSAAAQTVQTSAHVFEGRPFLWVEAENYASLGEDPEEDGWKVVNTTTPILSTLGVEILPANSNVSGSALLDDGGGGQHSDTALYELRFSTPGTYQLYTRHSMFDFDGNGNYGNEDSIFLSPAFNKNSHSDWVGFEGLDFDESDFEVEIPNPGFGLDPDGFKPSTGNSPNDGWYAIRDWGVKSEGTVSFPNTAGTGEWDGHFNWYNRPAFVSTHDGGGFDGEYGFKTEYVVTEEMVGETVTFEIGTREPYGVFDGFLFILDNDVDLLDVFSQADLDEGILAPPSGPIAGDFNANGSVENADLTLLLNNWGAALPPVPAGWVGDPPTGDAIDNEELTALLNNWGNSGASGASTAVPEPATFALLLVSLGLLVVGVRR